MGSFSISGVFTAAYDPDMEPHGLRFVGRYIGGKGIYQGKESGLLRWPIPMYSADYNELHARWATFSGEKTSGALPKISGYGWRAVSAWWGQPLLTGWDGPHAHGVTMPVWDIENL